MTLENVQKQIFQERIGIKSLFRDYDPLRKNRVTKSIFVRALTAYKINLKVAELEKLADQYAGDSAEVDYAAFCEDVESVFVTPGLEKDPLKAVPRPGENITNEYVPVPFEGQKEEDCVDLLRHVAHLTKTRGITLKYDMKDFDPANRGTVTRSQFMRNCPFPGLTLEEKDMLADRYATWGSDGRLDVHYRCMHDDLAILQPTGDEPSDVNKVHTASAGRPHREGDDAKIKNHWTFDNFSVEQRLQAHCFEKGVRAADHFKDFDPLKKGTCTCEKVRAVLTLMKCSMEQDDFDYLVEKYAMEDGMFNYAALLAELEDDSKKAYVENGGPLRNQIELTEEEHAYCDEVETRINAKTTKCRIQLKPSFWDFDRCHQNHVSKDQFARVMATMGYGLSNDDVEMLSLRYCDKGDGNQFNYTAFLNSCKTKHYAGRGETHMEPDC